MLMLWEVLLSRLVIFLLFHCQPVQLIFLDMLWIMDWLYQMGATQSQQATVCNAVVGQGISICTACLLHWQFLAQACNVKIVTSCLGMLPLNRVVLGVMSLRVVMVVLSMAPLSLCCLHLFNLDVQDPSNFLLL